MSACSTTRIKHTLSRARAQCVERDASVESDERIGRRIVCRRPQVVSVADTRALQSLGHSLPPSDAAVQRRRAALASAARAHNATTRSRRARDAVWIVPVHEAAICRSAREPRLTAEVPITTFRTTERTVFHAPCSRCEWTASYHVHSRWLGATLRLRCLGPRMLTRRPTAQR